MQKTDDIFETPTTTVQEVETIVNGLPNGVDDITYEHVNMGVQSLKRYLLIFLMALLMRKIPQDLLSLL